MCGEKVDIASELERSNEAGVDTARARRWPSDRGLRRAVWVEARMRRLTEWARAPAPARAWAGRRSARACD
jgi:hypothetical protein